MGKIKIIHKQANGEVEVHITDGSLSDAVPMLREVMASCDKKKDLKVSVVELETEVLDTMSQAETDQSRQARHG